DAHRKLQATRLPIGDRRHGVFERVQACADRQWRKRSNWCQNHLRWDVIHFPRRGAISRPGCVSGHWRKRTPRRPSEVTNSKSTILCCRCNTQMLTRRRKAALRKPRVEGKAPAKHALQLIRRDLDLVTVGVAEV